MRGALDEAPRLWSRTQDASASDARFGTTHNRLSFIVMQVCLPLAMVIITLRLALRAFKRKKFSQGDFWCLAAGIFTLGRLLSNHFLLNYGTTRVLTESDRKTLLEPMYHDDYKKVVLGSKIVIITRTFFVFALWSCKMAVSDLIAKLIASMPWEDRVMRGTWISLFFSFIGAVVPVYVECIPFDKHWQIHPAPGKCVIGNIWIVTYEVCNILTDIMLLTVPLVVIFSVHITLIQRLRLILIFSIGIFLITVSILRIKEGYDSFVQRDQTIWSSFELFLAVVVAVVPTIYGLICHGRGESSCTWSAGTDTLQASASAATELDYDAWTPRGWKDLGRQASIVMEHGSVEKQPGQVVLQTPVSV